MLRSIFNRSRPSSAVDLSEGALLSLQDVLSRYCPGLQLIYSPDSATVQAFVPNSTLHSRAEKAIDEAFERNRGGAK